MQLKDVPVPEIGPKMRPEVVELRRNSPHYLFEVAKELGDRKIISFACAEEIPLSNIDVLKGGVASSCYWLDDKDGKSFVLKLRRRGVDAESEWIRVCETKDVKVPHVKLSGVIPSEQGVKNPVKYLVLEGIKNSKGERAKLGVDFYHDPQILAAISSKMGTELAKIHTTETDKPFGGYADIWGADHPSDKWGDWLHYQIDRNHMQNHGYTPEEISTLKSTFPSIAFPERGVYAHVDFGLHNVLVTSTDPIDVVIFDPNPRIADPYFDIAHQYNRMESKKLLHATYPDNEKYAKTWANEQIYFSALMTAYQKSTGLQLDPRRLAANQIAKCLDTLSYEKSLPLAELSDKEREETYQRIDVWKKLLKGKVNYLLHSSPSAASN